MKTQPTPQEVYNNIKAQMLQVATASLKKENIRPYWTNAPAGGPVTDGENLVYTTKKGGLEYLHPLAFMTWALSSVPNAILLGIHRDTDRTELPDLVARIDKIRGVQGVDREDRSEETYAWPEFVFVQVQES